MSIKLLVKLKKSNLKGEAVLLDPQFFLNSNFISSDLLCFFHL